MREAGLDSRVQTALPGTRATSPDRPRIIDPQALSSAPALMLPPRLGILRRPGRESGAAIRRLVVPVPLSDVDEAALGRLIWQLATAAEVGVLLLAKVDGPEDELVIRRRLTTLAALLRRRQGPVETIVVYKSTWIRAVRQAARAGDLVVCPSDPLHAGRKPRRTLADQVVTELDLPAYLLEGLRLDLDDRRRFHMNSILGWAAPLAVLAPFGAVQIQIVVQTQGWLQTLLLATTVGLELASLLAVESLVSTWR
jgi:hypothetical protein